MDALLMQWVNLIVRWIHIITGIAWIGASFYFNWLEGRLNRTREGLPDELAGDLWAVHGGGFYHLMKYKVGPEQIPPDLHWFKYEAYFTWISGFCLLGLVYYMNGASYLLDPAVSEISQGAAVGLGIGALIGAWIVYDLLCKSPLLHRPALLGLILFSLITAVAYGLTQVFSSRGAYIHVGAMMGTIMAANVFFVIIPCQKIMVKAAETGDTMDPALGKKAGLRSLHNNYFTLPVLFIMISNHYPITYGHRYNWLILAALGVISAGVRHWFNLRNKGHNNVWILPAAALAMLALALVSSQPATREAPSEEVTFAQVRTIINQRCITCHSATPTHAIWKVAPAGAIYDTPEQIQSFADKIKARAVDTNTMPLGNETGMTDEERAVLGAWIAAGAKINP